MTSALFADIEAAPDPAPPLFSGGTVEDDAPPPSRTSEPTGKPRGTRTRERDCEQCGNTFIGGRKICPDCAPAKTGSAAAPRTSAKLQDELLESTISVASDLSAVAPTVAGVLIARAEVAVAGMMELSKGRPRVQAILKRTAGASKIAELMSTTAMLVIAGMVDFGKLPLESPILDRLGYADIVRDDKGKAKRDPENGTIVKQRRTLREIHDLMTGQDSTPGPIMTDIPQWDPTAPTIHPNTGTGNTFVPPMNWTP